MLASYKLTKFVTNKYHENVRVFFSLLAEELRVAALKVEVV